MNAQIPKALPGDAAVTTPQPVSPGVTRRPSSASLPPPTGDQQAAEPARIHQPSAQEVQQALENLKRATQPTAQNLQFSVDKGTGQTVIRVVDGSTQEVIRQIPSEEILALAQSLEKLSGLLLKDKA